MTYDSGRARFSVRFACLVKIQGPIEYQSRERVTINFKEKTAELNKDVKVTQEGNLIEAEKATFFLNKSIIEAEGKTTKKGKKINQPVSTVSK